MSREAWHRAVRLFGVTAITHALRVIASFVAFGSLVTPVLAQTVPPAGGGGGITLSPATSNANSSNANAQSNPVGQNINQQNNFNYAGQNSFAPGIQCATPYITSSVSRFDGSQSGGSGQGNYSGGLGLVVPLGGSSSRNCLKLSDEIVIQRQLDTCLNIRRAGFKFDPAVYPELAKRCNGLVVDTAMAPPQAPPPQAAPQQISPPTPPTVITVPANPAPAFAFPSGHSAIDVPKSKPKAKAKGDVARQTSMSTAKPACAKLAPARRAELMTAVRNGQRDPAFGAYIGELQAACVSMKQVAAFIEASR
ncbi:MAG: hypothetical protein NVSMB21_02600 [Vulcanimicrobiaceae bacterium]